MSSPFVNSACSSREGVREVDVLVLGAGAKGTAIAMKASVVNDIGGGPVSVTIVEQTEPAAAWLDNEGVTSSREILAISPSKDVGFPYESSACYGPLGAIIDQAALSLSWPSFLVAQRRYAQWVDAGSPPVQRRVYGKYLQWVLEHSTSGVEVTHGRVEQISLLTSEKRWLVKVSAGDETREYSALSFVLTGPGAHREIPHDLLVSERVLTCEEGRMLISRLPSDAAPAMAIIGGGEGALSCLEHLRSRFPDAPVTFYTPGMPASRTESFLENRIFSNPDSVDWCALPASTRRDFIARSDRGVFGPERLLPFAMDEQCHFTVGRVRTVTAAGDGDGVLVHFNLRAGRSCERHDYAINCTGYDPLEQLRQLLDEDARQALAERVSSIWETDAARSIAIGRFLEIDGLTPMLQAPGLAGFCQGPGFSNLGSLGILGDRVIAPFVSTSQEPRGEMAMEIAR